MSYDIMKSIKEHFQYTNLRIPAQWIYVSHIICQLWDDKMGNAYWGACHSCYFSASSSYYGYCKTDANRGSVLCGRPVRAPKARHLIAACNQQNKQTYVALTMGIHFLLSKRQYYITYHLSSKRKHFLRWHIGADSYKIERKCQ